MKTGRIFIKPRVTCGILFSLKCGRRIMVITQASQACDAGSIPVARSKKKRTAMVSRHCRFSFVGLKLKRRNRTDEVEFRRKTVQWTVFRNSPEGACAKGLSVRYANAGFPSPAPKKRTAMVSRHCRFSFVGLKLKRRNRTDEVEFRRSDAKKWIFQFVG